LIATWYGWRHMHVFCMHGLNNHNVCAQHCYISVCQMPIGLQLLIVDVNFQCYYILLIF
jgi:hypothetical protein